MNIKFWDKSEFLHFVTYIMDKDETDKILSGKKLNWIGSAYPRACFHLGFLKVAAKEYGEALAFLDRGVALEPSNPNFKFEKAVALTHMRRFDEALRLYDSVTKVGLHVSPVNVARALRGRGGVLVEMGQLDRAEAMFKESLKHESGNKAAINELAYIAHLRSGGRSTSAELIVGAPNSAGKCASCGLDITGESHIEERNGKSVVICKTCQMTDFKLKKWWEVWK